VPLTLEALEAGKHVYVEKPLAETAEECEKVVKLQKESGKRVFVGMNRRLAPAYLYASDLLWKNGGPRNMFYRIADSYCLDWGLNYGPGQRIVHEVCHIFDILRFFARSEAKSVYAMKSRDDDEQFSVQFESGTIATVMSSGYVTSDMPKEHFEAVAEKGAVTVEDFAEARRYTFEGGEPIKKFAGHVHPMHDNTHALLMAEMGADAMAAVRRTSWEYVRRFNALEEKGETDTAEFKRLKSYIENNMPLRNYFMDKGWLGAIEHFADCIMDGSLEQKAASSEDALRAAEITEAAIRSRELGAPVTL
jgi:predicted dehydrogenase